MANSNIAENNLTLQKSADKVNAVIGDTIKFSITAINEGDILINNITVIDTLVSELEFKEGSVVACNIPLSNESILSGIDIGSLKPGEIKSITFEATVIDRPENGLIENSAIAKFNYDQNLDNCIITLDKKSNEVSIKIDIAEIKIIKKANKTTASRGDVIGYKVQLINSGTLEARNILFSDALPKEVSLVDDVFEVDGKVINNIGHDINVYVGNLEAGESSTIKYRVIVNASNCSGVIENKAAAKFNYNLCQGVFGEKISCNVESGVSEVKLGISTFKQLSIDETLCIPCVKPDIEEINNMDVEAEILECHVIKTPSVKSNEGQILSGYKAIIKGVLKEIIEYTSDTAEQSVHSAHYSIPFSSFIVLPSTYVVGSKIDIDAKIEDIYYRKIDNRCFFKNITILINAKILSC